MDKMDESQGQGMNTMRRSRKVLLLILLGLAIWLGSWEAVQAQPVPLPSIDLQIQQSDDPVEVVGTLRLLVLLTILSLVPAILILVTSFTRVVIVLSFVRNALATQQTPPNQVLIGLALFLTFFIMAPVFEEAKVNALDPYLAGELPQEEAFELAAAPFKEFMFNQTREKDLALFVNMSDMERPETKEDIPLTVLIPAFIISELKTAFQMGFIIFIPFLVIDVVVASTLMSMGMFMVPPIMISLPFKLMLFVMVDGWYLVVKSLLESFG